MRVTSYEDGYGDFNRLRRQNEILLTIPLSQGDGLIEIKEKGLVEINNLDLSPDEFYDEIANCFIAWVEQQFTVKDKAVFVEDADSTWYLFVYIEDERFRHD